MLYLPSVLPVQASHETLRRDHSLEYITLLAGESPFGVELDPPLIAALLAFVRLRPWTASPMQSYRADSVDVLPAEILLSFCDRDPGEQRRRSDIKPFPFLMLRSQRSRVLPLFQSGPNGRSTTRLMPWRKRRYCRAVSVTRGSLSSTKRANRRLTTVSCLQSSPTLTRVTEVLHRLPAKLKRPLSHLLGGLSPPAANKRKRGPIPAISIVDARPIGVARARALEWARCSSPPVGTSRHESSPSTPAPERQPSFSAAAANPSRSGYLEAKDLSSWHSSSAQSPARAPARADTDRPASSPPPPRHLSHEGDEPLPASRAGMSGDPYPPFHASHPALHCRIRSQQLVAT